LGSLLQCQYVSLITSSRARWGQLGAYFASVGEVEEIARHPYTREWFTLALRLAVQRAVAALMGATLTSVT
ncbi:hypothetical protein, partial [Mesorhizobium sp. M0965]|uniref:hypothetical protein n=1 Tax=Mesorhizobium sp. M0965 TaxID=2957036 RepID=UPI00333D6DBA